MTQWEIDYAAKQAREAIDTIYKQYMELKDANTALVNGQVMKLQKYPWTGNYVTNYSSPDVAIADYNKEFEACQKVHEENLVAIKNNIAIKTALFKLLENLGIQKSYSEFKRGRSKSTSYHWPNELGQFIPTTDNWDSIQSLYTDAIARANKVKSDEEDEKREKLEEMERVKAINNKIKMMGILANKYDLSLDADQDDILKKICDQDKYLALAHGLLENRMDWSDGPDSASCALRQFKIETSIDKEIHDSILPYIEDWDGDGRIFRDMEWSYDKLFEIVELNNPSLYSDYQKLMEIYIWY